MGSKPRRLLSRTGRSPSSLRLRRLRLSACGVREVLDFSGLDPLFWRMHPGLCGAPLPVYARGVDAPCSRRGARVVDWDGLENRCAGNRTVGSNPTLSATTYWFFTVKSVD